MLPFFIVKYVFLAFLFGVYYNYYAKKYAIL